MKPLFEVKPVYNQQQETYFIYRIESEEYKATLMNTSATQNSVAPKELILNKENGKWKTADGLHDRFGEVLGMEIDVFNTGYGDLLGKI